MVSRDKRRIKQIEGNVETDYNYDAEPREQRQIIVSAINDENPDNIEPTGASPERNSPDRLNRI